MKTQVTTMSNIFIFILFIYGLSNCFVYASGPFRIFEWYRNFMEKYAPSNFGEGASCMMCTPFQFGIIMSLINYFIFPELLITPSSVLYPSLSWFICLIIDGAVASGSTWLLHTIQEYFEFNTKKEDE